MDSKKIIQAIGDVDEKYVEEAADLMQAPAGIDTRSGKNKSRSSLKMWRIIAMAACLCLAGSLTFSAILLSEGTGSSQNYRTKTAAYSEGDGAEEYFYEDTADYEEAVMYSADNAADYEEAAMYSEEYAADYDNAAYDMASDSGDGDTADIWNGAETNERSEEDNDAKKIIYTVWMNMQTREFDKAMAGIEAVTSQCGGYFESQNISNSTDSYRNASFSIRVPAENLDTMLDQIGDICTVTYINKSAEDVSSVYYDTQSRLTTAKTKLERLQELLKEAENMEDIITIESAISDTEWDIDYYGGELKDYDSLVKYSTVNIILDEVYEVEDEAVPKTFGEKISQSFQQGLKAFGQFINNALIWLAGSWIVIVIIAAVIAAAVLVIRGIIRRKK